ncbi:MAG: GspE/PulE family protein [Candidatus Margulisbacteria bacterium]|nr:GspE/PulE family protein [Candidatus Margulisiibacteriota bacterium]
MIKTLAEALVEKNIISPKYLSEISNKVAIQNESFVNVLVNNGYVDETKLALFIAQYLNLPFVNLTNKKTDKSVLYVLPEKLVREKNILPLFKVTESLILAMIDPMDYLTIEEVENITGLRVEPVVVSLSDLSSAINRLFGAGTSIKNIIESIDQKSVESLDFIDESGIFKQREDQGPVNKLAYLIISSAIHDRASDIHMEPKQNGMDVRFRLDGVLHKIWTLPHNLSFPLISSLKILAKMDIVEKRLPLDGSFRIQCDNRIIDIRVSSYPMIYGEKVVLRLLDQDSSIFDLENLGMAQDMLGQIKSFIHKNFGIFLVTGPTGSGKTTTLYAILNQIKSIEKNIVTIEDPVEYHINLINQSEINNKSGLTFSRGLRSVLRQDPDVILIGEIRDRETAEIAFQAALTGHLVFSTLHTNDTASTIARLIDMDIEPYLISSVLLGILSQRLLRRTCKDCQDIYTPDEEMLIWGNMDHSTTFLKGKGCKLCRNTGFKGRVGIFELLTMNDHLKDLINHNKYSELEIRAASSKDNFVSLKDDGLQKARQQFTTLEEVFRVVQ